MEADRAVSRPLTALAAVLLVPLAGCGGDGVPAGPDDGTGEISLSVTATDGSSAAARSPAVSLEQTDGQGNTLVLDSVRVVLREIELERQQEECPDDAAEGREDDACEEFDAGIRLLELPMDGSVRQTVAVRAPADTYDELEFEIHKPDDDEPEGQQFIAEHPAFEDVSIRVRGTFNGEPFLFLQDLNEEQERELVPPLVVEEGAAVNVTLHLDVGAWFVEAGGGLVDPATANDGGPNEDLVEENIESSIEVFEDDDEDGRDDDEDDGGEEDESDDGSS